MAVAVGESLEHLRPWMPWIALEPTTLKDREKLLAQWDRDWAKGIQYSFGMFRAGRVVGGAGLMRRIAEDGLEIGYWVHPEFTGRGFATRAAETLTTLGLGLRRRDPYRDPSRQGEREPAVAFRASSVSRWWASSR